MELFSPASLHKMKPDYLYIGEKFDSVRHCPYLIQMSEHQDGHIPGICL